MAKAEHSTRLDATRLDGLDSDKRYQLALSTKNGGTAVMGLERVVLCVVSARVTLDPPWTHPGPTLDPPWTHCAMEHRGAWGASPRPMRLEWD